MTENIFDRAADRLRGCWIQGALTDDAGNVCLVGALSQSTDLGAEYASARGALSAVICREHPEYGELGLGRITDVTAIFNDSPDTTEEDALLMLKYASADWDEEHA